MADDGWLTAVDDHRQAIYGATIHDSIATVKGLASGIQSRRFHAGPNKRDRNGGG